MGPVLNSVMEAVERIDAARSIGGACQAFFDAFEPHGARALVVQDARADLSGTMRRGGIPWLHDISPPGWSGSSASRFINDHNPFPATGRMRRGPFRFREAALPSAKVAGAFWDAARVAGTEDGVVVPLFGPGMQLAGGVSTAFARRDWPPGAQRTVELAAYALLDRILIMTAKGGVAAPRLSPRERDCIAYVAEGRTEWEIGELLGVSSHTVHSHVEHAKAKLEARTRPQAVARAIAFGLI